MANRYNTIIVSPNPRGRFLEVIVDGTPKPGTCMTVKASTEPAQGGKFTFEAYNRDADSNRAEVAVLLEDELQGITPSTAYTSGQIGRIYFPLAGDFLQMLYANVAGTADDHAIGEMAIIDDGTGKLLVTTGSPEIEPFRIMETITDPTADFLALTMCTGH